jgi:23S rRNA (uracil1939-C5)-methyltransferase
VNTFFGTIEDLSSEGLGVAKHPEGMTFFVNGAWPGDAGELEIISKEKRYGFAKFKNQIEWSQERSKSVCKHLGTEPGKCGGCPWMIANYESQLKFKNKYLATLLKKFHYDIEPLPIHASDQVFGFRNRAQLKTNGKQVGYVSPKSRSLAPIEDCMILNDSARGLLKHIRENLPNKQWEPPGRYQWNFLDIDEDMQPQDIEINKRRPFKQANRSANIFMREWVKAKISSQNEDEKVLELFCGSGNFTEILSQQFQLVLACEMGGTATQKLRDKNLEGVSVIESDIFARIDWQKITKPAKDVQTLFLDPPREGFKDLAAFTGELPQLKKILYVSCDPYSFASNCKDLINNGWHFVEVQPVDQFPHTPHMELMAVLEKRG